MTALVPSGISGRPTRRPWSGDEFDQLVEAGKFDVQRVELINGEILEMPLMNDPQAQAVRLANYALLSIFPPTTHTISIQCPMRLGESRPLPDLVVVTGTPRQVVRHPETALLVIEVSDTTLEYDRTEKSKLYAAHGLPDYWIVNLQGRCVEVHRNPLVSAADLRYGEVRVVAADETFSPLTAPQAIIRVADLLP
jgi:Uma2 family endonuclease